MLLLSPILCISSHNAVPQWLPFTCQLQIFDTCHGCHCQTWFGHSIKLSYYGILLGPYSNTCFTRGGKGLSSNTLMIQTQTLTFDSWLVARDCWLMTRGSWIMIDYIYMLMHEHLWHLRQLLMTTALLCWLNHDTSWCGQTMTWITIYGYSVQSIMIDSAFMMDFYEICMDLINGLP